MRRQSKMFCLRVGRSALSALALALLLAAGTAAVNGRDFFGFYRLGEITDLGEHVSVPLTVRIENYSGADVVGARIVLEDSLPPSDDLGTFATIVDIRDRESVRASETFTVPRREYDRWQEGATPQLRLDYTDAEGKERRAPVELGLMLLDEEEQ